MKHALLLATAAVAALSLAACQKKADGTVEPASPVAQSETINAAQDATSAAVGAVSASAMGANSTEAFVSSAGMSDIYEVRAGQIALQKARSAGVKAFAKMMVADHTAMMNGMQPMATAAGKTPPTELDERRKGLLDNLKAASAEDFDRVYLEQQEAAHKEALTLMQGYADKGDDTSLKSAAAKAGPKVQAHLDRVRKLQADVASALAMKK